MPWGPWATSPVLKLLQQELANYSTSQMRPHAFLQIVLLEHSLTHSFTCPLWLLSLPLQSQSWVFATETVWPSNPDTYYLTFYREGAEPCDYSIGCSLESLQKKHRVLGHTLDLIPKLPGWAVGITAFHHAASKADSLENTFQVLSLFLYGWSPTEKHFTHFCWHQNPQRFWQAGPGLGCATGISNKLSGTANSVDPWVHSA